MKNNKNRFITFWGGLTFSITLMIVFPIYMLLWLIFGKNAAKKSYWLTRLWGMTVTKLFFTKLNVLTDEIPDRNRNYIFICNHRSMLDIPIVATLIKNPFRFLAKRELVRIPLLGVIIRIICVTVDRKTLGDRYLSYEKMKFTLQNGESILLFPEGTRAPDNIELNTFQNGAFRLAAETGVPIFPITLWNTKKILAYDKYKVRIPLNIKCFLNHPIIVTKENSSEIKEYGFNLMFDNIQKAKSVSG